MATAPQSQNLPTEAREETASVSLYVNRAWKRFLALKSNLLTRVWNLYYHRRISTLQYRRRKSGLPLPLSSSWSSLEASGLGLRETSRIIDTLEDILEHTLSNLHEVQKNLLFWQSRGEGTEGQKLYFMVFERGPRAFLNGTIQLIRGYASEESSMQALSYSAAAMISERIAVLTHLQQGLATFLAQVYMEIHRFGELSTNDPQKSLPSLLMVIGDLFLKLEALIGHPYDIYKSDYSALVDGCNTLSLHFDKLPKIDEERSLWTDCVIRDALNIIYQNLQHLNNYLSLLVSKYRRPRRMTLHWLRYTSGAVGISICSVWLLRHSSLMGSSDIDNWIRDARESITAFWKDHVEEPLLSIRDELFETFKRRHKSVTELEEVQLTANSLHRMLMAFSEQTKGEKLPENLSDQDMLEIVMARYEKELTHPLQSLLGGELARALLIQIQKLKLDIETAMLELNQILRANEINFAILAALPAFFLSLSLLVLIRKWVKQDKGAEGKGRIARLHRRLLVVEVENRIIQHQNCLEQGLGKNALWMFGLLLYSLDRLHRAVERHAKQTGEWLSLRQDIIDLSRPDLNTQYKLVIASHMERIYDCLLPICKRR